MSMIGCNEFLDQLELWMGGERSAGAQAHARGCARCGSLVSDSDGHPSNRAFAGGCRWRASGARLDRAAGAARTGRPDPRRASWLDRNSEKLAWRNLHRRSAARPRGRLPDGAGRGRRRAHRPGPKATSTRTSGFTARRFRRSRSAHSSIAPSRTQFPL